MTPDDRSRKRTVVNVILLIQEHLEAMQRDVHGIEYLPWKREVDDMWRRVFVNVNRMSADTQVAVLEDIRETWTVYLTYYSDVSH
ncbi:MAG: hypothetical protein QF530_12915 [SAR202 cluster bacterium]|nr:hypothetical protein [SAR202 cluster bacterium]